MVPNETPNTLVETNPSNIHADSYDTKKPIQTFIVPPQKIIDWISDNQETIIAIVDKHTANKKTSIDLSLFGLQNADDVFEFMMTPEGEALLSEIQASFEHEAANQEFMKFQREEHQALMRQIMAFFFLAYLSRHEAWAAHVKEMTMQINEKVLEQHEKTTGSNKKEEKYDGQEALEGTIKTYQESIDAITVLETENLTAKRALEAKSAIIERQGEQLESKYNEYEASINDFEKSDSFFNQLNDEDIDKRIEILSTQMDHQVEEISSLIQQDKDDEALVLRDKHNALNLQFAMLQDMKSVRKGEKRFVNIEGKDVTSLKDASFILPIGQTIIKVEDTYYLLKPGQTWDSVKDNVEEKTQAQRDYDHSKNELMNVKTIVNYNKGLETAFHQERLKDNTSKLDQNSKDKRVLDTQRNLLEAAKAEAVKLLNNLSPKPSPANSASSSKKMKSELEALKQPVSKEELREFLSSAQPKVQRAAERFFSKHGINMYTNTPIPPATMQSLLANLARFDVNPYKPNITPTPSPFKK